MNFGMVGSRRRRWEAVWGTALFLTLIFGLRNVARAGPAQSGAGAGEEWTKAREAAMNAEVLKLEEGGGDSKRRPTSKKQKEEPKDKQDKKQQEISEELKKYQRELLRFPKRDRLSFGGDFSMTYDNNLNRNVIRSEEGDTFFHLVPFVKLDLGSRKTDFVVEFQPSRDYYVKVPEGKDFKKFEVTVRTGRKIGKKTTLSLNDRLTATIRRDAEIDDDGKKVQYDNAHRLSLNHTLNRKLSLNFGADYNQTYLPHENFDQDSNSSVQLDPNLFFNLTPKTRLSLGYRWSISRSRTEASDKTAHEVRWGYSGKITGKSSLQVDLSYALDDPDSAQAAKADRMTLSTAFLWQVTPKTSLRLLYSNSPSISISDSLSGSDLLKSSTRSVSDSFSTSLRFRLNRMISTELSFDGAHSHSKTKKTGADNTRSRTWVFPFQGSVDLTLTKWLRLRFSYTYRHQIGNEESNEFRAHTWFFGSNAAF